MTTTCWIFCPNGDCGGGGGGATAGPAPPHPLEFTSNPAASRHAAAGRTRIGFRGRIIARTPWFSKACPYQPGHAYLVVLMWPRPVSVWGREILGSRKPPELGVPFLCSGDRLRAFYLPRHSRTPPTTYDCCSPPARTAGRKLPFRTGGRGYSGGLRSELPPDSSDLVWEA